MHTLGHDPGSSHAPLGFVDILALLTLATAIGAATVMAVVIGSWLI
jgi:hypothetical protein